MQLFQGVGAALVTPFNSCGEVDGTALEKLIEHALAGGVAALFACGTTGEPSTLTQKERERVIALCVEIAKGRVPVFAGCGGTDTAQTVEEAKRCQALGASGLLAVTPYYNKCTQNGAFLHYAAIADAVTIPVIAYNVPARTGFSLAPQTVERLLARKTIRGVKEASGDIHQMLAVARVVRGKADLYCGDDALTLPAFAIGACGLISVAANIIPERMTTLASLCLQGKYEEAADLQYALAPFLSCLTSEVNPIPCKKALALTGLCLGTLRLPLTELSPQNTRKLKIEMAKLGLLHARRA